MRIEELYQKIKSGNAVSSRKGFKDVYTGILLEQTPEPAPEPTPEPEPDTIQPTPQTDVGDIYTNVVASAFNGKLPEVTGIKMPSGSSSFSIAPQDRAVWEKLYFIKPPRKGEVTGGTAGSGNGEIALFWFLKSGNPGLNVTDNRGKAAGARSRGQRLSAPDLLVNDVGLEVKSFPSQIVKIGKFRQAGGAETGKLMNNLLNYIFGFNALLSNFKAAEPIVEVKKADGIAASPGDFSNENLIDALEKTNQFIELFTDPKASTVLLQYDIFKNIIDKTNFIVENLPGSSPEEMSRNMWKLILENKFNDKPGIGGFIVNCNLNGTGEFHHITQEAIDNINIDSAKLSVKNTELHCNLKSIFGP
jgi:hypothetical protein